MKDFNFVKQGISVSIFILMASVFPAGAQVVTLDNHFNQEMRKSKSGGQESFHYLWDDKGDTGFSKLGADFVSNGATLHTLTDAPSSANLKNTSVYIIVDPDTKKESQKPNYITAPDIKAIVDWVKKGGVLLMLANDSANVELLHFNELAAKFGMHFNSDLQNHVINDKHFEDGSVKIQDNPILTTATKIFMKDVSSITVKSPAKAALVKDGIALIATARYGKGTVLAVGDPWLYNEYVNGRLPAGYENDKAAKDIAAWLLKQAAR
jgi:hypothetical protein